MLTNICIYIRKAVRFLSNKVNPSLVFNPSQDIKHTTVKWPIQLALECTGTAIKNGRVENTDPHYMDYSTDYRMDYCNDCSLRIASMFSQLLNELYDA